MTVLYDCETSKSTSAKLGSRIRWLSLYSICFAMVLYLLCFHVFKKTFLSFLVSNVNLFLFLMHETFFRLLERGRLLPALQCLFLLPAS